jgi:hypothetical protein
MLFQYSATLGQIGIDLTGVEMDKASEGPDDVGRSGRHRKGATVVCHERNLTVVAESLTADVDALGTEINERQRMSVADHELCPPALPRTDLDKINLRTEEWLEELLHERLLPYVVGLPAGICVKCPVVAVPTPYRVIAPLGLIPFD